MTITYSLKEVMQLAVEDARRKKLIPEREKGGLLEVVFEVRPGPVTLEAYAVCMEWSETK